jgi:hypothetical protein
MNIRQVPGKLMIGQSGASPHIVPASQVLFLAVGMFLPATGRRGFAASRGEKL